MDILRTDFVQVAAHRRLEQGKSENFGRGSGPGHRLRHGLGPGLEHGLGKRLTKNLGAKDTDSDVHVRQTLS